MLRPQITLWGPDGQILDYGSKQWSGLVGQYYLPRWKLFFDKLEVVTEAGEQFDQDDFLRSFLSQIGQPFCKDRSLFPTEAVGDSIEIARALHEKWSSTHLIE